MAKLSVSSAVRGRFAGMERVWMREPIVVLPAALILAAILCIPLLVFDPAGAVQIYGAGLGLAGILGGAHYNAWLTRRRDDRQDRVKGIAAARAAREELEHVRDRLAWRRDPLGGEPPPVRQAEHRALLKYLMEDVHKDVSTPITDEHILQLCQHSEAVAGCIMRFKRLRSDYLESADDINKSLSSKRPVDAITWSLFRDKEEQVRDELDELVPELWKLTTRPDDFGGRSVQR